MGSTIKLDHQVKRYAQVLAAVDAAIKALSFCYVLVEEPTTPQVAFIGWLWASVVNELDRRQSAHGVHLPWLHILMGRWLRVNSLR